MAIYTARTYQPEWHPELFRLTSLLTPLSTTHSSLPLMPDQINLTDEQQQILSRERELRDRLNYEHQGSQRYYHLLDTLQDVHSQMPVYGLGKYVRPYVHPEERQARQNALNLDRQLTGPRQSSLTPKEPPLLLQLSMASQKMPIRQYTAVDEQDEQIAKGTEQRLIQQLDQMEFGTAHFYAVRDRLEGVQERLRHYIKLRGGPVSYPTYVHPAERQREQQARPRLPSLSGQHGPVMPYQRVKDIDEQRYTRGVQAPQSRTLSDIQLQPYAYNGDLAQVYQNNPGALHSALHFNFLQMAARDILMGMDPIEAVSKIPQFNEAIRTGEIPLAKLVGAAKIMAQFGGRGGNMEYLDSNGKMTPARDSKMEKALRQLAGGESPALLASPSTQMPSREAYLAQLEAAQSKIEAWWQKTAQNAGITPGRLREAFPTGFKMSHEQLAFIESQGRQRVLNAGGGTGKTDTIFASFLDLVFNKHIDPSTITLVSMTNSGKNAILERFERAQNVLPNWKIFAEDEEQRERARRHQFRTFHSLAKSELMSPGQDGRTVMEQAGFTNFEFLGDAQDPIRGQDARKQYLESLMREKDINQYPNMNDILGHIAGIKQNQGHWIADATGKKSYVHDVHYQKGKKLWESGNRKDKDAWYYFYESNLKRRDGSTGLPQQQETGVRYADFDDSIRMWGIAAAKGLTRRINAAFVDEYQNSTYDMLRAMRSSSSPSSYIAFGGDMGQRVIAGTKNRPDQFLPEVLPGIDQHVLTGNYRGSHESVYLANSINADPTLQAYGTSQMQVPMSNNPGLPSTYTVDPTFEGLHAKAWHRFMNDIVKLTPEQLGQNMEAGQHPFTGAAIKPSEAPFIFQMHSEFEGDSAIQGFLKVVEQELAKTVGPTIASRIVREGFSTSVPTKGSQHAYALTVPKAQARGFAEPSLFVTRGGQWDTAGYHSNLLTMEGRTTQQSHYYSTNLNFPHSYWDNSFDIDPVTQESYPHGFVEFRRRAAMRSPQVVEGSLASGHNNIFRDFIENVIDVNRAVPLGNRIPQIGEAAGMLPGTINKEYTEEGSSYSGMSTNQLSRAALAGDWKNKPNMKVFELGEDLATSQLRNGPLEEDSSLRTSSAEAFMYDAKKLLSGVNKAKTEKVLEGGKPITLLPQYSVAQSNWNPPATRLLQPGGNAYQSLDMSIGQKTAGPVEVPLHLTDFGLSASLMQPHPVVLGHEGGKIQHIPVNPEWEQANTPLFEGHDEPGKDWGKQYLPSYRKDWTQGFRDRLVGYTTDETRARSGIHDLLIGRVAQQHPLVQQLLSEEFVKPNFVKNMRRMAKRYRGHEYIDEGLAFATLPVGSIRQQLEGKGAEPGLHKQLFDALLTVPRKPRAEDILAQVGSVGFNGKIPGLGEKQNQRIVNLAREIVEKERLMAQFRQADPSELGNPGIMKIMSGKEGILSHRFSTEKGTEGLRKLAQYAVQQAAEIISTGPLDAFTIERLKEIGRDMATNPAYVGLDDETRRDFASIVQDLSSLMGSQYDPEQPMKMTEEDLADLKQKNPLKGMMMEKALRGENGELKNMQEAFPDVSKYASLAGSIERTKKGQELGLPLAYSRIRPFITENENYLERLEKREGGGILHPQAYQYMQDAQGNAQYYHTGEMVALEAYERSLDQQARNPHITEGHRQALIEQLGQVSTLRLALSDPTNHRIWGHVQNILSHLTYGEGAFDPRDTSDEGRETPGFRSLFRYQRMEGREGVRSLDRVQENVAALQEMASHIQQTGMVKRAHVNRLLAAMGHMDPNAPEFRVLTQLSDRFGSANAELPLQDIARLFPQEQNNLTAQFTRFPLLPGQEVEFRGGMPGYTEIMEGDERFPGAQRGLGMQARMRGTLLPWDEKTPFGYSKTAAGFRYNKMVSQTKDEQGVNEFMRSNRLDNEEAYGVLMRFQESGTGKVYPVRADQLGNPTYQPNRSISYYVKGNTDTTIITPQESPIVEAPAGISSRIGALTEQYRQMSPEARAAMRASLFGRGRKNGGGSEPPQLPPPVAASPEPEPLRPLLPLAPRAFAHFFPRGTSPHKGTQGTGGQGFITNVSSPSPHYPFWLRGDGFRGVPPYMSFQEITQEYIHGTKVPPTKQRQIMQAYKARQAIQGQRIQGLVQQHRRNQSLLTPTRSLKVSQLDPKLTVKKSYPLLPMAPRARATYLPYVRGRQKPGLLPARMVGVVSPLERQLFSSPSSSRPSLSSQKGPFPPVRPESILSGLSPDERARFAKILPAWAKHYGKQQNMVHADQLPPGPDPILVQGSATASGGNAATLHMAHMMPPPTGQPLVEDQLRDLAGMIRTGSQEFGMHALSEEQRLAVEDPSRFRMISGGPGGGKTNTIAGATGDWIATGGMLPQNIISVSALHSGEEELNSRLDTPRALARRGSDPRYELPKSSTIHSLAHDILLQKEEDGSYPNLEAQGIKNFSGRILYEPAAAERETMTQAQYEQVSQLHFLKQQFPGLREKDTRNALEFINNMKANRFGEGVDYNAALELGRENLGATMVVGKGRNKRRVPTYEAALAQMQDAMSARGDLDYNDLLYHTARHLEQNGIEGLPMHLQSTSGLVVDEGQDITQTGADMVGQFLGAIGENNPHMLIGMDPAQSLLPQTFGAVDVNKVEGLWEAMAQGFGEPLSKHTLKENRRSDLGAIALNNTIRNRRELEGTARSPVQRPPKGGVGVGQYEQFHLAPTHPQLFRNMWRNMLKTAGVSYSDMATNVQAGKHPFAGIDFSSAGHVMPKDIPAILNEHKDQAIFAHEATGDIAKELGVSPEEAKKLYGQMTSQKMYKRPLISRLLRRREKPSEEEVEKMAHFPVVRHSGARSFDALYPHVDVTQSYGGDDPDQALISHFKKMFVALSRVRSGGRNQIFATNRPLPAYEKEAYLKNPGAFGGGMTNAKGDFLPSDGDYAFKQYGNMQVPPHFDKILRDRDKELLEGGISPTDSFFPPEVQPAIQGIAQELGVGVQQPQPASTQAQGIPASQIIRGNTPPPTLPQQSSSTPASASSSLDMSSMTKDDYVEAYRQGLHPIDYLRAKNAAASSSSSSQRQPSPPIASSQVGVTSMPPPAASSAGGTASSLSPSSSLSLEDLAVQMVRNHPDYRQLNPMEQKAVEQSLHGYPERLRTGFSKAASKGTTAGEFLRGRYEGLDYNLDQLGKQPGMHYTQGVTIDSMQELIRHMQKNPDQHLNAQNVTIKTGAHSIVTIDTGAGGSGGTGQRPPGTGGTPGGTLPPGVVPGGPGANTTSYLGQMSGNILNFGAALPPSSGNRGTTPGGNTTTPPPWWSALNPANQEERTLDRIAGDITRTSQAMKQTADDAAKEGSSYRMATLALVPKGSSVGATITGNTGLQNTLANAYAGQGTSNTAFADYGTQGFFNFPITAPGNISDLQQQYLQWFSKTQIAQGLHDYSAQTGAPFSADNYTMQRNGYKGGSPDTVNATTAIMGIAALAQMDPSQLMPMMTQVSGYTAGSPTGNNANITQLASYMNTTFGGNFSQSNVVPYLSAMQNLVPTLYGTGLNQFGQGPIYGSGYSQGSQLHAASLLQLAMNAGYTASDLPDISTMLGNVAQAGMAPNLQQQYQNAQLFGVNQMTASPQYFEFQQSQLSQKQQIQQMQAGLNVNAGIAGAQKLSISQLQIEADNASIQLNQANLQMSQEQFAQNQASFNFNQWMQTQELGPIGETPQQTGRAGYFNYMNRQMGAGYNPLNADSASNFQLQGQPFGLQNAQFYAGIENQRSMLTLSRSPLLADAAYQQQMKYLNEQETFYNNQLQLQNKDRAFQQTWGQRSLDAQGKVLAAQIKQNGIQTEQLNFDKTQAKIQGQYYSQQLSLLQQIQKQTLQQIQGQGPLNGQNITPENLIQTLANEMKTSGYVATQRTIQGYGLDAQSQGELMQMVQLLSKGGSISQIEKRMSGSQISTLMSELQQYEQQGASSGAQQHAGKADQSLAQGGTGQDWKNLTDAVTNSVQANNQLAQFLSPTSSLQKYLGEIGTYTGTLTGQFSSLIPILGGLNKGVGGLGTLIEVFAGGGGGAGGAGMGGSGGTGGSMLPLPSMQVHGPFGGAIGGRGRGGSSGVGGEFDMGPSLPNTKDTRAWLNLFEDMVSYKQRRTNNQTVSHYGISSPPVNADFHQKLWYGIHQGVDFAAAQGTPLLSFNDGTVKNTGFFPWGGEVDVQIPGGMIERYLHLSQIGVSSGQKLKAGDRIGLTGGGTKQSGLGYWSKGPHSHVQIDTGNINAGINPWVIWEAFGDTNLRDFYVGAQAQYNAQIDSQTGSRGYQRSGGGTSSLFHMADGGIAMRPLATRLGDGGEPEAVIPLSKLKSVMASVASGSPTSATTTHTSPSKTVTIQTLVGNMHVTIHTQAATMSDQEKDNLFTDLIDVLNQASQELLGTLQ